MAFLLPQLLSEAACRHPDNPAVSLGGTVTTHAALEVESNRLAHLLIAEGVRKGDRVGLFLPKSVATVTGIFAILKAGAAYVPIDPMAPPRRVAFIVRDCGIRCLLTRSSRLATLEGVLGESSPLDFAVLMEDGRDRVDGTSRVARIVPGTAAASCSPELPGNSAIDTDLAYILYTSGSTGEPKGVMISHLNALTFVNWASQAFRIEPGDRLSNHAPFHFDLSIFDLFAAVKAGASVHIIPEDIAFFGGSLLKFVETNRITVWYSVPSALVLLVQHGQLASERPSHLRLVLFAGEVFPTRYLRLLMEAWANCEFYNLYGPTETNVCTYYHVQTPPQGSAPIPIGRACENTDVFAVTDGFEVARPGEVGELVVRGSSVMKGYWGLPEKTRQVVVDRTDASGHPEQIYRTGDLVTLQDGFYQFLGRRDHMIKSRGYRIELGEIEAALYSHRSVLDAVALAIPDPAIGHRLHAIVVCADPVGVTAAELARHCAERMPKYMVPGVIEFRDGLPKTSTGKIDRQRLSEEVAARVSRPD